MFLGILKHTRAPRPSEFFFIQVVKVYPTSCLSTKEGWKKINATVDLIKAFKEK